MKRGNPKRQCSTTRPAGRRSRAACGRLAGAALCLWLLAGAEPAAAVDFRAYLKKGNLAHSSGNYAVAETFYQRSYEVAAALNHEALIVAAVPLIRKGLIPQGKFAEALKVADDARQRLERLPVPNAETRQMLPYFRGILGLWKAEAHLRLGQHKEALALFQEATENSQLNRGRAYVGVAQCYVGLEQWPKAEAAYNEAISLSVPSDARLARLGLIRAIFHQDRFQEAIRMIWKYAGDGKGPEAIEFGMLEIASHLGLGKVAEAFAVYRKSIAVLPGHVDDPANYLVARGLAEALARSKNYESALFVFSRIFPLLQHEAWRQEALLDWADTAAEGQQLEEAVKHYSKFVDLYARDPRRYQALLNIGKNLVLLRQSEKAIAAYAKVLTDEQAPADLRFQAGYNSALHQDANGDSEKAIALLLQAGDLEVSQEYQAQARFMVAEIHLAAGNPSEAAQRYEEVATRYSKTANAAQARFRQGVAHTKETRHDLAAKAFANFLEEWPGHKEFAEEAAFQKGLAELNADIHAQAVASFKSFLAKYPAAAHAPLALLNASRAAAAADLPNDAIDFLTTLLTRHPESKEYPEAVYRRADLRLAYGHHQEALTDSYEFLRLYAKTKPELAAHVSMWLGDHYTSEKRFQEAEKHFLNVCDLYEDSRTAATALYEAAKSAYRNSLADDNRDDLQRALAYLDRLAKEYPQAPDRIRAQALFLRADVLSLRGEFRAAAALYQEVAKLVPKSERHFAAIGRLADSYHLMAKRDDAEREQNLNKALALLSSIIDDEGRVASNRIKIFARYRRAKILEMLGQRAEASVEYNDIFYDYLLPGNPKLEWKYFSRAGFDLARIYTQDEDYSNAIKIYELLAKENIPTSKDAAAKALDLKKNYLD